MVVLWFIPGQGNLKEISCSLGGLISILVKWLFPVSRAHLFSYGGTRMVWPVNQICFGILFLILLGPIHPSGYNSDNTSFLKKLTFIRPTPCPHHPTPPLHHLVCVFPFFRGLIICLLVVRNTRHSIYHVLPCILALSDLSFLFWEAIWLRSKAVLGSPCLYFHLSSHLPVLHPHPLGNTFPSVYTQ